MRYSPLFGLSERQRVKRMPELVAIPPIRHHISLVSQVEIGKMVNLTIPIVAIVMGTIAVVGSRAVPKGENQL